MTVFFSTSDSEVNVKKVKVNDMHLIECNPRHISHKTGASTCPPLVYPRGGEDSHMKQKGMLVVSLRGINFGFWSRLGTSGQSANI